MLLAVKCAAAEDLLLEMRKVQAEMGGLLIKSEKQDHIEDKTAVHERLASVRKKMVEAGIVVHHRRLAPGLTILNQNAQNFQVICNACIGNYQMAMTPVTNPKEPGVFIDTWMIPEEEKNFEELLKSLSIMATMTEIQK